jgi:hypothetical protein
MPAKRCELGQLALREKAARDGSAGFFGHGLNPEIILTGGGSPDRSEEWRSVFREVEFFLRSC